MATRGFWLAVGITGALFLQNSASASTRQLQLIFATPTPSAAQIARCAASSSGWAITFADDKGLSSTRQFGEDTANLNVMLKPDGSLLATLSISLLFGISGNGSDFLDSFVQAFPACGATPTAKYLEDD